MAASKLFQALLLAASLGWNGVFAQGAYGTNTTSSDSGPHYVPLVPVVAISVPSLAVPITVPTSASSSWSQPSIAYSPVTGHSDVSLEVPATSSPSSTSSEWPTIAPYPVIGHTEWSLDVPTTGPLTPSPATGHSESSLDVPPTTTTSTRWAHTFKSPVTQHTAPSLAVPPGHGHGEHSEPTSTPPIAYSPATGYSQSSLQLPPTTTTVIAPIPVTAKSQSELQMPTRRPTTTDVVATVSLPPEPGHGRPGPHQHDAGDEGDEGQPNPGNVIASLVQGQSEAWTFPSPETTAPPSGEGQGGAADHVPGGQIVSAGASAATVGGTTYSRASSGGGVYVNGKETTFSGAQATDSVAMAVMSALGGGQEGRSSTLATTTTRTASSAVSSGGAVAEQTGNAAAVVLPGLGMGCVGVLMALL